MILTEDEKQYLITLLEETIEDTTIILEGIEAPLFGVVRELQKEIELANKLLAKVREQCLA